MGMQTNIQIKEVSEVKEVDKQLFNIINEQSAQVRVIGVGGGGGNSISRMKEVGIKGAEMIAMNTDAQDLLYTDADSKILLGKTLTRGLGAGSDPQVGQNAAYEAESEIRKKLQGADMVFITCGLGGGTGTGAAPVIANIAKKMGMLTLGVVTLPFSMEGQKRIENAMYGLKKLEGVVDTLIVIPNDKLLDLAPELPIHTAFKVADEVLTNAVKGTTELITTTGLINLDFADIKAVMSNGGVSVISIGESETKNRAEDAVEKALQNPLLDVDVENSSGALVNVIGGNDMSLEEAKRVVEAVSKKLKSNAKLIWGAQISKDMGKSLKVMLIMTGVKSSQMFGIGETEDDKSAREMSEHLSELGIDSVKAK